MCCLRVMKSSPHALSTLEHARAMKNYCWQAVAAIRRFEGELYRVVTRWW